MHRHSRRQDKHATVLKTCCGNHLSNRKEERHPLPINIITAISYNIPASRERGISSRKQRNRVTYCLGIMMNPVSQCSGSVLTFQQGLFGQRAQLQMLGARGGASKSWKQQKIHDSLASWAEGHMQILQCALFTQVGSLVLKFALLTHAKAMLVTQAATPGLHFPFTTPSPWEMWMLGPWIHRIGSSLATQCHRQRAVVW